MKDGLLTTVVGSYPQPDWLIDRHALSSAPPPRIRQTSLWRVAPEYLQDAQDAATIVALRDMERAGIDVVTDGEIRRESYSNRFATSLEGLDLERPAQIIGRSGRSMPVPRVVGPVRRIHSVLLRDVEFLRENTDRRIKVTIPGPFTMAQQVQNEYYKGKEDLAIDLANCVNLEAKEVVAAGADVLQLDEPWLQTFADEARRYAISVIDRALDGIAATTVVHSCFGYAAMVKDKPSRYSFLTELEDSAAQQISIEAAQPKLDLNVLDELPTKTIILGVLNLNDAGIESPEAIAARAREALMHVPPDRLLLAPDCGMKYLSREVAFQKLKAMKAGSMLVSAQNS